MTGLLMALLLERLNTIREHWDALQGDFHSFLPPENGPCYIDRDELWPGTATLKCRNFPDEIAQRDGGNVAPVALLLRDQAVEEPQFWIGWYEEWRTPTSPKAGRRLQFRSSAVTIYRGMKGYAKRQLIRAEWAGPDEYSNGNYRFQSHGSAHPHWHVDGIRSYLSDLSRSWEQLISEREAARDRALDRVRDFGKDTQQEIAGLFTLPPQPLPAPGDLAWTEVHLASCARWPEQPWPGPGGPHHMHAHNPESCQQVRLWLSSCVRYLQAEIEDKLIRPRHWTY